MEVRGFTGGGAGFAATGGSCDCACGKGPGGACARTNPGAASTITANTAARKKRIGLSDDMNFLEANTRFALYSHIHRKKFPAFLATRIRIIASPGRPL